MKYYVLGGLSIFLVMGASCVPTTYDTPAPDTSDTAMEDSMDTPAQDTDTNEPMSDTEKPSMNWEDTIGDELRAAFADKYDKSEDDIQINIELARDNTFVRGEVGLANPDFPTGVEGGIFYAVRDSISGEWIIVHDGNGIVPCEPLELADFSQDMMGGCQNY